MGGNKDKTTLGIPSNDLSDTKSPERDLDIFGGT